LGQDSLPVTQPITEGNATLKSTTRYKKAHSTQDDEEAQLPNKAFNLHRAQVDWGGRGMNPPRYS